VGVINKNLEAQAMALINDYCASAIEKIALGKLMSFDNGYAFQSKTYLSSGKYRIITIKNVLDGKIDSQGAANINEIPTRMKSNCFLSKGDVLLSLTGNVGRVGIVYEDNLLLNQRVAKICPFNNALLPWLYYYFRLPSTKVSLETIAKGTAQQNLSPVETLKLQIPFEMASANNLSQVLLTMFNMEISNFIESQQLSKLRDVLLPKLMSGELDVSDIDL
jgi:type I restriction enzyme S subunit